jgi:hypothetical protein
MVKQQGSSNTMSSKPSVQFMKEIGLGDLDMNALDEDDFSHDSRTGSEEK